MRFAGFRCVLLVGGLTALAIAPAAGADPLDVVNAVRRERCGGNATDALGRSPALAAAAQAVANGNSLRAAVETSRYRAVNSTLLYFEGARDDSELARLVAQSCARVGQPGLRDAGVYQRGRAIWIVLAEPFTVPSLDAAAAGARVLQLVNQARAQPRRCGDRHFDAAPPLRRSATLERAASAHARDMAQRGSMSHAGSDGSTAAQRVTRAGYKWSAVAENVAAGQRDADRVVNSWLSSPGHCANLMSPEYSETGVAFATNAASEKGIYWVQSFATPDN
jgi:uncharacterized protein YkwD